MATDYGSQDIKVTAGRDKDGNPIGVRKDGAKVVLKLVDMKSGHERHAVNTTSCVIDRMLEEGWITRTEHEAAEQFHSDFHEAGLAPKLGASYNRFSGAQSDEMGEAAVRAHKRWVDAVRALGAVTGDIVCSVVLHDYAPGINDVQRVQIGLRRLAAHYGKW